MPPSIILEVAMRIVPIVLAAVGIMGFVAAASPARADWDDHDGWRRQEGHEHGGREHQWREQRWRDHEWRERAYRGYAPPVIYAPPPAYYYAPPQQRYYGGGYAGFSYR